MRNPARINITPWPRANKNSINMACGKLAESDANAIIPANIGVEHGVPASANTQPKISGYIIRL